MRLLFLCKRYSTGKDSLADRYGRLFHLPAGLARQGWDVTVQSLSYRLQSAPGSGQLSPGFRWQDFPVSLGGIHAYRRALRRYWGSPPGLVWSGSDALHVVIGNRVARKLGVPHVVDLYDDYESFGLTQLPGLRRAFRAACVRADGLTVVSTTLMETLTSLHGRGIRQWHIPNGVSIGALPFDRTGLLERLGLPRDARLIGMVGALDPSRGVADLFNAFAKLAPAIPELHLVLAGRESGPTRDIRHPRIHRMGMLPHSEAMAVLAALDVSVVCNRDSRFSRACHPMKLVESAAVGVPVVAASVGEVARLLAPYPEMLYPPGDSEALVERIARQLETRHRPDASLASRWEEVSLRLHHVLADVAAVRLRKGE